MRSYIYTYIYIYMYIYIFMTFIMSFTMTFIMTFIMTATEPRSMLRHAATCRFRHSSAAKLLCVVGPGCGVKDVSIGSLRLVQSNKPLIYTNIQNIQNLQNIQNIQYIQKYT